MCEFVCGRSVVGCVFFFGVEFGVVWIRGVGVLGLLDVDMVLFGFVCVLCGVCAVVCFFVLACLVWFCFWL